MTRNSRPPIFVDHYAARNHDEMPSTTKRRDLVGSLGVLRHGWLGSARAPVDHFRLAEPRARQQAHGRRDDQKRQTGLLDACLSAP
jgi:hypothetical protein